LQTETYQIAPTAYLKTVRGEQVYCEVLSSGCWVFFVPTVGLWNIFLKAGRRKKG
jgi:hypothetical protein